MHITNMTIGSVPPFTEQVEFQFDERVNVFVGPNSSGKSTVMKALAPDLEQDIRVKSVRPHIQRHVSTGWPVRRDGSIDTYAVPRVYLPPMRMGWPGEHLRSNLLNRPSNWNDLAPVLANFREMFEAKAVFHAIAMLYEQVQRVPSLNTQLARIAMLSYSCAKTICREILSGGSPQNYSDTIISTGGEQSGDLPDELINAPVIRYANAVTIIDTPDKPVFVGELSSGTQGVYLWIWYLAFRMAHFYEFRPDWPDQSAILMIDEIENHLHPTWQRRVIPALLDHFSGLQIFATTHSPFIVAGLKKGQVHRLYRDDNSVVRVDPPNEMDIVGWTMDEILRGLMAVDDPTDEDTAGAAAELRHLRDMGPLENEDDETKRQARILELRQRVDRDLLAGGPAAAQREIFETQFAEAFERYRRSRDLSQENS